MKYEINNRNHKSKNMKYYSHEHINTAQCSTHTYACLICGNNPSQFGDSGHKKRKKSGGICELCDSIVGGVFVAHLTIGCCTIVEQVFQFNFLPLHGRKQKGRKKKQKPKWFIVVFLNIAQIHKHCHTLVTYSSFPVLSLSLQSSYAWHFV